MFRFPAFAIALLAWAAIWAVAAQTNRPAAGGAARSNAPAAPGLAEQLRAQCIAGRRSICGRILRIFPEGLLVESGYTNLIREPLTSSWLVPGQVSTRRAENLVETREPGEVCVGTVLLTDLPRGKPRQYDYVIIAGYPAGDFTYTSVNPVRKTVRRFSANLEKAVRANLAGNK